MVNDINIIKNVFYKIVKDAQKGYTLNVSLDEFSYVRFNYIENGILYGLNSSEDIYGSDNKYEEEYDAEFSNGTINYLPTLVVNNKELFFNTLSKLIAKYYTFYNFKNVIKKFGEENIIKNIILTIFSNARYVDYENPIEFMNEYMDYFDDNTKLDSNVDNISLLDESNIITSTKKEKFGYETPYYFETIISDGENKYYLPNISYGISNNKCYIYAIQNKQLNDDTTFNKRIKRLLNKINANVLNDIDYDNNDSILGVPPSFVLALSIFLKVLKNKGIDNIEIVTFLPDRYFEKKATEDYDADIIQKKLTEKMVLLFYRIQYHIDDIQISYPIYDSISNSKMDGDNLKIQLYNNLECYNNPLLEEILSKMDIVTKNI